MNIFGMHDYAPLWTTWLKEAGRTGWCVHTEAVGCDPADRSGKDYTQTGVINVVRLNNGYGKGTGTIPTPERYLAFAQRCANFVMASRGIEYVVIGNEIGLEWEWPSDEPLTLHTYLDCYRYCYQAIKQVAPTVKVAPQAPAPWNDRVPDARDWVVQLTQMLQACGQQVDWIALHAYTRGYDESGFNTKVKMGAPFEHRYASWETLYEFLAAIPAMHRKLPLIVTEANGNAPWPDHNSGWIQNFYRRIDAINSYAGNQKIVGACLFRWAPHDTQWDISAKGGSLSDFRQALVHDYRIQAASAAYVRVASEVGLNLRDAPYGNILRVLPAGEQLLVLAESGEWLKVNTSAGETGYVHGGYVVR